MGELEIYDHNKSLSLRKRTMEWLWQDNRIAEVCEYIANGGTLVKLCKAVDLQYSTVMGWVNNKEYPERRRDYEVAVDDRKEWMIQKLLSELHDISMLDVRQAFNDDGELKDIKDMPPEITRSLSALETTKEGVSVKIRFLDKIRAIETLGKSLKMFTEMVEHSGTLTLEQMVEGSIPKVTLAPAALPDKTGEDDDSGGDAP